jgi:hypothetical protein
MGKRRNNARKRIVGDVEAGEIGSQMRERRRNRTAEIVV